MWKPIGSLPKDYKPMFVAIAIDAITRPGSTITYTTDPWCVWRNDLGTYSRWPHSFPPTHYMELPPKEQRFG